jgi:glycosyltransferase involved in cell wall biosynthesis
VTRNYFAPPAGSRSGVADYAETLRLALGCQGPIPVPLYHLGNNPLHADIYRLALKNPGVIVLHDAVLHHFLLGSLSRADYIEEFVYNYGEWRRELAPELWAERGSSGTDPRYFRYPMIRRVVEGARAVIVHNPGAAEIAREHGATNVHVIPHFYQPVAVDRAETAYFRERLGVPQGSTLFGIFGYLRETKRLLPSIQAFRRLYKSNPNTALLIAGEAVSADLNRLLQFEANLPSIHRPGHLSEADFKIAAATVDCCINLRYPAAGETSGIAIRLMGAGKPVILSDDLASSEIPPAACLRVTPGVAETAELFDHMTMVAAFPSIAREIGNAAARHIAEHHSLEKVVRKYRQVLCEAVSSSYSR